MSSVSTPFNAYTKQVTARMRARMHNQSYASVMLADSQRRLSPAGKVTTLRVNELRALQQEHKRTFDPSLKVKAVQMLQTLPLLSTDEDPQFVTALRALRVAGYFGISQAPSVFAILNHVTKHAYLLQGHQLYQIARVLPELQHSQSKEVLLILVPRIRAVMLASDVTAVEAAQLLRVLDTYGARDRAVEEAAVAIMSRTMNDLPLEDWAKCIGVFDKMDEAVSRGFFTACEHRLCEILEEAVVSRQVCSSEVRRVMEAEAPDEAADVSRRDLWFRHAAGCALLINDLSRVLSWLRWSPRRLMNAYTRAVLAYSESPPNPTDATTTAKEKIVFTEEVRELEALRDSIPVLSRGDMCFAVKTMLCTSFHSERALLLLSSRIAAAQMTPGTATIDHSLSGLSVVIESLGFFNVRGANATINVLLEEMLDLLNAPTLQTTSAVYALAGALEGLVRAGFVSSLTMEGSAVVDSVLRCRPLQRFAASSPRDPRLTARLLLAVVQISVQLSSSQPLVDPAVKLPSTSPLCVRERSVLVSQLLVSANQSPGNQASVTTAMTLLEAHPDCFDASVLEAAKRRVSQA